MGEDTTTPVSAASGTGQQLGTDAAATSVSTTPVTTTTPAGKAKKKEEAEESTSTEPEELQAAPFKKGDEAALDLGVAGLPVEGTISGVYSDSEGLSYQFDVQVADAQPMRGKKASVLSLTVPAAALITPEAATQLKQEAAEKVEKAAAKKKK